MIKKINNFISDIDRFNLLDFIESIDIKQKLKNKHISEVASKLNGQSYMFDISKTELSNKLATYQSSDNLIDIDIPPIFFELKDRISSRLNISGSNVFLQILNQESGGLIHPHYDSSIDGYITYKCNVCVLSRDYQLFVGDDVIDVSEGDLYSFEASLYKHWANPFTSKRIILSYGFILPYQDLGRDESDPRVRLSKRIVKYFQN